MHCVNFDKFRDTAPSKVIKRENLAKAKNRTSKLKTTRLCTHIIYERRRANSTETFTGKSKQYKLKRFILKWPTSLSGHLLVPRGEGGCLMVVQLFELGLPLINQSRRYTKISLKDTYRLLRALLGRLSNDDGGVNENGKTAIGFGKKQPCTCSTLFCTFLCRHCTTTTWRWKCLISRFVEEVNTREQLSFFFPELW